MIEVAHIIPINKDNIGEPVRAINEIITLEDSKDPLKIILISNLDENVVKTSK